MNETQQQMQNIHRPSRAGAILFFILTLGIAAGIIVWTFFLNMGTVTVEGTAPFRLDAGNKGKDCDVSPCTLTLKPRAYQIAIKKDGFYEDLQNVTIIRGQDARVKANFIFVATFEKAGNVVLPIADAPLRDPFIGMSKLENFPSSSIKTQFSASGDRALVLTSGKQYYLYDVAAKTKSAVTLAEENYPAFVGEDIAFLLQNETGQSLMLWNNDKPKTAVIFERNFIDPEIMGSPAGDKVVIKEGKTVGEYSYYLVDLAKKSRKKLEVDPFVSAVEWTSGHILFESNVEDNHALFALDPNSLAITQIENVGIGNVIEYSPGIFMLLSKNNKDSSTPTLGVSISDMIEESKKELTGTSTVVTENTEIATASNLYLIKLKAEDGSLQSLLTIPIEAASSGEEVGNFTADTDGKKLYFQVGKALYEIILEK